MIWKTMNSNGFIRPFFAIRMLKNIPLAKTLDQTLPNENRVVKVHLLFCFRPLRSLGSFAKETFILIWHNFLLLVSHYFQHFFLKKKNFTYQSQKQFNCTASMALGNIPKYFSTIEFKGKINAPTLYYPKILD